jgi:hypothetical protein
MRYPTPLNDEPLARRFQRVILHGHDGIGITYLIFDVLTVTTRAR